MANAPAAGLCGAVSTLSARWALCALAAAGCFSDRGVAIEIEVGGTGATSVELFLGTAACDPHDETAGIACTTIAPPPAAPTDGSVALDGAIWFRDAPAPYTAEVRGGTATFQLRAGEPTTLPIAIAVGYAADPGGAGKHPVATATLRDLAIPVNNARVVTAALVAASPVQLPPAPAASGDRVLVWRKQTPVSSCVVVEHWNDGAVDRDFIVPEDDPDCDDVTAPECNPAAWHGSNAIGGGAFRADCFRRGAPACELGALGCSDDIPGKTATCLAQPDQVCVPDLFCGAVCDRYDETCLRMLSASDMAPRIECDVPAVAGVLDLCPADHITTIDLDGRYGADKCEDQPLITSLIAPGFDTHARFGGAEMGLASPQKPCHFELQWKTGAHSGPDTDFGLIQVSAHNGALLIPLVLHFLPGVCGTVPFKCTVTGPTADTLWSCAP